MFFFSLSVPQVEVYGDAPPAPELVEEEHQVVEVEGERPDDDDEARRSVAGLSHDHLVYMGEDYQAEEEVPVVVEADEEVPNE